MQTILAWWGNLKEKLRSKTQMERERTSFTREETETAIKKLVQDTSLTIHSLKDVRRELQIAVVYFGQPYEHFNEQEYLVDIDKLVASARFIASIYFHKLMDLSPANITFFHFLRQRDFQEHYYALKYLILVAQRTEQQSLYKLLDRLPGFPPNKPAQLLLCWLNALIQYRISALYVTSTAITPLIRTTYLNLFSLLRRLPSGFDFALFAFINIYMLCKTNMMKIVLPCLDYFLGTCNYGIVNEYIPSHIFADYIGFVAHPFSHEVLILLLTHLISQHYLHDSLTASLLLNAWSSLRSLLHEFPTEYQQAVIGIVHTAQELLRNQRRQHTSLLPKIVKDVAVTLKINLSQEHQEDALNYMGQYRRGLKKTVKDTLAYYWKTDTFDT